MERKLKECQRRVNSTPPTTRWKRLASSDSMEAIRTFGQNNGAPIWLSDMLMRRTPDISAPDTLNETSYTALNLIWSPYKPVTLGAEYLWGLREHQGPRAELYFHPR
jgi:hypothetical protein